MTISAAEFLDTLFKSNLMDRERLDRWQAGKNLNDGVSLANQLVKDQMLTDWQAKYLLTGRHQLFLGPYQLLERTNRDELGDRFLGLHSQLARKVDIRVLPANLTQDPIRRAAFIKRVRQTSVLDHPQLSHVYDIDQQGGRYFVVQEHIDGIQLGEKPPSDLSELKIANWLEETLAGIKYVHANKISHGAIEFDDLIVDSDDKVKVQNLAICQLRPNATNGFNAIDDFRSISKLFIQMIDRLPKERAPESRVLLRSLVSRLAFIETQSKDFEKQLLSWRLEAGQETASAPAPTRIAVPTFEAPAKSSNSFPETKAVAADASVRPSNKLDPYATFKNSSDTELELKEPSYFSKMAVENPVGLLSSSFVASMLVAGALTYAFLFLNPTSKKPIEGQVAQQPAPEKKNEKPAPSTAQKNVEKDTKAKDQQRETLASVASEKLNELNKTAVADAADQPPTTPPTTPTSPPTTPEKTPSTTPSTEATTEATTQAPPQTAAPDPAPPSPDNPRGLNQDSAPSPEASTPIAETPKQDPPVSPSTPAPATAPVQPDERTKEPFSKLPPAFALPTEDITTEIKFGDVFIHERFLLGAEILSPAAISSQKFLFQMERDEQDKQRWIINFLRNPKDKKTAVAALKKSGNDLSFQWLPEARTNRNAGLLRNCLIKLFTPEHSAFFRLRLPVEIEPMILQDEQLTSLKTSEIPNLPNLESVIIEVLPVNIPETSVSPSVIEFLRKDLAFGRVLMKAEDTSPLAWVNLSAELKQKLKLRADIVVSNGQQFKPVKNVKEIQDLSNFWKQTEANLLTQKAAEEAKRAPSGGGDAKQRRIDELDRQITQAKEFGVKFQEYANLAPKMLNQEYGVRVVARYDGHEVELAKTKLSPAKTAENQ